MVTQEPSKDQERVAQIQRQVELIGNSSQRMTEIGMVEIPARLKTEHKLDRHSINFLKGECRQMRLLIDNLEKKLEGV